MILERKRMSSKLNMNESWEEDDSFLCAHHRLLVMRILWTRSLCKSYTATCIRCTLSNCFLIGIAKGFPACASISPAANDSWRPCKNKTETITAPGSFSLQQSYSYSNPLVRIPLVIQAQRSAQVAGLV